MAARLSVFHKGLILILSPILLETLVVVSLCSVLSQIDKQQAIETVYKERSGSVIRMSSLTFQACMLLFGMAMPGQKIPGELFDEKLQEVRTHANKTAKLMESDDYLRPIFSPLHKVECEAVDLLQGLGETIRKGTFGEIVSQLDEIIHSVVGKMTATAGLIDKFISYNNHRLDESRAIIDSLRRQHITILLTTLAGNIALACVLLAYFNQAIIERLKKIRANTELLKSGQDLPEPQPGTDEIAMLDRSFFTMQQALKATRRRESLFFENAADVICKLNESNEFTQLNPATRLNWGISPDTLLGKSIESIICEEDRQSTLNELDRCRTQGTEGSFESRVLRRDGAKVEFHWSVYLEPIEKQLYCVAHDVNAQKEIERARERYFAIVSHDLKQPVTSISNSFAALTLVSGLTEKALAKIGVVSNNLLRLQALVEELSTRQSFVASDQELEIAQIDLADMLEKAAADVEVLARARQVRIVCRTIEAKFEADRNRIMQVLINLLSNAIKFSPESAEIELTAADDGDSIRINVTDHGRGIPEDQISNVFEKFKQVAASDGKRAAGTGLGLPICKQIVEQHNGSISVSSKLDEGSTFTIHLPKVFTPQSAAPAEESTASSSGGSTTGKQDEDRQRKDVLHGKRQSIPGARIVDRKLLQDCPLILKGAVLVGVPLVFEVILVSSLTFFFLQSEKIANREIVERQIANCANDITFCYRRMAISLLTPDAAGSYENFQKDKKETTEISKNLRTLAKGDPKRSRLLEKISRQIKGCNASLEHSYVLKQANRGMSPRIQKIGITLRLLRPLGNLTKDLQDLVLESSRIEALSPQRQKHLRELQIALLSGGLFVNIVLGLILARLFSNDIRSRLVWVAKNTSSLASEEELAPPLGGSDEIAVLDKAFHQAAAELTTARKKERTVFDNSKEIICSFDEAGRMTGVNPAATKLLGYSRSDLIERGILTCVCEDDRNTLKEKLFGADQIESPLSFENRLICADGSQADFLWSATRAAGEKEVFCVAHDISARKEAARLRNEFLSIVSHDLRTPLAGILMNTAMIEEGVYGEIPQKGIATLKSVATDVNRLLELINDLLDIEKLEAGMMAFTTGQIELRELAHELTEKSRKLLEDKQIVLNVKTDDAVLAVDRDRFLQALSNLLASAVERSPAGANIDFLAAKDNESCSLIIRDYSVPLDSQTRNSIFDRFALSTSNSGRGRLSRLSIPLSKSIIKSQGGEVVLADDNGCGNEFIVRMPLYCQPSTT